MFIPSLFKLIIIMKKNTFSKYQIIYKNLGGCLMYKEQNENFWGAYKKLWKKHPILMTFVTIFCGGFILGLWLIIKMIKMIEMIG